MTCLTDKNEIDNKDIWYRADDRRYANYDAFAEFDQPSGSHVKIEISRYSVERYTPKGVSLKGVFGDNFSVLGTAIRQRAVPTIDLALQDLLKRKERHVLGCEQRLKQAHEALQKCKQAIERREKEGGKVWIE